MRNESPVGDLLERAAQGRESAWQEIIKRYSSLVASMCRRCGVLGADAEDVAGNVWLHLVAGLRSIREPEALPGWLAATTRHECLAVLRNKRRLLPTDQEIGEGLEPTPDTFVLNEERRGALRHAITQLSERDKVLLGMLFSDPPTPYARISSALNMPIGAIGPTRQRCLTRVRGIPAIAALLSDDHRRPHPVPPPAS
jgi:RNA polymerase sigma factor (sigma-70 family)